jgi:hypothetical protein
MPEQYCATMRNATVDEVDPIYQFYLNANDPNVVPRPRREYDEAARSGFFYIIESNGRLIAAAGLFYLVENLASLREVGSAYVIPPMRGFKLQQLLLNARMAAAGLFLDDVNLKLITAVKPENEASRQSVSNVGFVLWPDPLPEAFEPCAHCISRSNLSSGRKCCCDFYILPKAQICMAASSLLQNELWHQIRPDGAELVVECKPQFLTNEVYRTALQELVETEDCQSILPS